MEWLCGYNVAGLFAAGGTGEFFSLSPAEVARVVGVAVEQAKGRVPVIAGAGYGTAIACEMAVAAEKAGADGILLLPPYLVFSEQEGLAAHIEAVCAATKLGVIVYNRDNAMVNEGTLEKLCKKCPNLVGYKDGVGDVELMTRVYSRMGDRLAPVRRPADGGNPSPCPISKWASPPIRRRCLISCRISPPSFTPRSAAAAAKRSCEPQGLHSASDRNPRNRKKGYAVSMIKAGMKAKSAAIPAPVRPPLTDLTEQESGGVERRWSPAFPRSRAGSR